MTVSLAYGCGQQQIQRWQKYTSNAGGFNHHADAAACNAGHITRWSTSRASLEATGCRHQASASAALPWWPQWSMNLLKTQNTKKNDSQLANLSLTKVVSCMKSVPQNGPSTQLIDATRRCVKMWDATILEEELSYISRAVCNFPGWHQKLRKHAKPLFYNACNIYFY